MASDYESAISRPIGFFSMSARTAVRAPEIRQFLEQEKAL
jgi:hypothetical protein